MSAAIFDITTYGAISGASPSTGAIQKAIDSAAAVGGATVFVPAGRWVTTTLFLKSGVTLHLSPNAVLEASTDMDAYPKVDHPTDGNADRQPYHLLVCDHQHHVTITGGGTILGNGPSFWLEPDKAGKHPLWYRWSGRRVSPLVEIRHSQFVVLDGITIRQSPGWTVHLFLNDHVRLTGVIVENHLYGPNTDGFDINSCRDVFVSDCRLTCGDDAIIIKATADGRTCERIVVTNCIVRSNCIGIGIGAETESGVRQVAVSNCVAEQTMRMFAIGSWSGGWVEDVVVSNLTGSTLCELGVERPIHIDIKEFHGAKKSPIGRCSNVSISNVVARTKGRVLLTSQSPTVLENITLRDVTLVYDTVEDPQRVATFPQGQLSNFNPQARVAPAAFVVENARDFYGSGLRAVWPAGPVAPAVPMSGFWSRNVTGALDVLLLRGHGKPALDLGDGPAPAVR